MKIGPIIILLKSKNHPRLEKWVNGNQHAHDNPVKKRGVKSLPPVGIVTSEVQTSKKNDNPDGFVPGHDFGGQI